MSLTVYQMTKNVDKSKFKALADDQINSPQKLNFVLGRVNILGKGENAGNQDFLLYPQCFKPSSKIKITISTVSFLPFPQCFKKHFLSGLLKAGFV